MKPYISNNPLFRSLNETEVEEFRRSARQAAVKAVADLSKPIYHPIYRDELERCILRLAGQTVANE